MPEINNFTIDTSDLSADKTSRQFTIQGSRGAEFMLQVVSATSTFYNWKTKTFNSGFKPDNMLKATIPASTYTGNIVFPASTTTSYNVVLIAPPDSDTVFSESVDGGGKKVLNKSISQVSNTTVTIGATTANTQSYGDPTTPANLENPPVVSITSTGDPSGAGSTTISNTWTVHNRDSDTYGFGLRLTRQPVAKDFYFETTETVNGAATGDTTINVDDLTDIAVGMFIVDVDGSDSVSGTCQIVSIDEEEKQITVNVAQSFVDNATLTLRGYGEPVIKNATGLDLTFTDVAATAADHSITVKENVTGDTIKITNAYGISGGSFVRLSGEGLNTSSTNDVNVVTLNASGDDTIAMDLSSTLTAGTVLYVDSRSPYTGSATQISIFFGLTINEYPSENRTISLNLDNFITPGVSGS